MVAVANNSLLAQPRVRVYRLYTQIDNQDVRRMQICIAEQLVIEDYDIRAARDRFELNVWPARFALFEASQGEMVRVPQEEAVLEMPTPSDFRPGHLINFNSVKDLTLDIENQYAYSPQDEDGTEAIQDQEQAR